MEEKMSNDIVESKIDDASDVKVNVDQESDASKHPYLQDQEEPPSQSQGMMQEVMRKLTSIDRENGQLFEAPINQVIAIIGGIGLFLLVIALMVDELWTQDVGDAQIRLGWHKQKTISKYENMGSKFNGSRKTWIAFGILTVFALCPAVIGLILDKQIIERFNGRLTQKTFNVIMAILFGVSALLIFIASVVVAAYDEDGVDRGASPILGFITFVVMLVPIPLLIWF